MYVNGLHARFQRTVIGRSVFGLTKYPNIVILMAYAFMSRYKILIQRWQITSPQNKVKYCGYVENQTHYPCLKFVQSNRLEISMLKFHIHKLLQKKYVMLDVGFGLHEETSWY